jgi:outer membrane protein TolC
VSVSAILLIFLLGASPCLLAQEESASRQFTLEDCIDISLASSPGVIAAQERTEQARAAIGRARAGFYPRLSIQETFVRSAYAPTVFSNQLAQGELSGAFPPAGADPFGQFNDPGALSNWNSRILLEWPVYRGGQNTYGTRAASARLNASELALEAIHNNLVFSVSSAYYEILKSRNSIALAEESIRRLQAHLDIAQARLENDIALKSDVLRVEVRLAEAEETLEIARHNLERAKSRLNLAMGRSINKPLALAPGEVAPMKPPRTGETLDELITQAHRRRSEIEMADLNIEALENSVRVARAELYPHVDAFAHYDYDTEDFSGGDNSWTVGLGASLSIFDGFLTRSNVRSAQAKLREAEARKKLMTLHIEMQVKNSYLARSEAAARMDVLKDGISEAEEALRIVSERYSEGLAIVTDLLDAEVALTNTRLRLVSARHDYMIADAGVERAVGLIPGGESEK